MLGRLQQRTTHLDYTVYRKQLIALLAIMLVAVILGLGISKAEPLDESLPIALLMMLFYIPLAGTVAYFVTQRFKSTSLLLPALIVALVLRYLVSVVFYFNHDALLAAGLRDDIAYYKAGLFIADTIEIKGVSSLLDVAGNHARIGLDSWIFTYFNALHFLIYPSMLLPVITHATIDALSGLFLYRIAHSLDLGEKAARYACMLWLFSPSAIGWASVNLKESLVVASVLTCIWVMHSRHRLVLRALALGISLILLAGLRWYVGLTIGLVVITKAMIDSFTQNLSTWRSVLIALLSLVVLVNVVSLIPRFEARLQSPEEAVALFSEIHEESWARTGTQKAFASAVRARAISPIFGWAVTLFALFFTPPVTQWLGIQQFRVIGTLIFVTLLVYSVWGGAYLWRKDKFRYWGLFALAIVIPTLLGMVPKLMGSRHRLQLEPIFVLLGAVGLSRVKSLPTHIANIIIIVGAISAAALVDLLF